MQLFILTLTVNSRSTHGQGRYLPVFKCVCSYQRPRSAHGPFTVREDICLYLNASVHTNGHCQLRSSHGQGRYLSVFKCTCSYKRSRSSHGLLMVSSRCSHGQGRYLSVFKCICSYKRSRSAHGKLTVSSRSAHGQGRYLSVFKCICSYKRSRSARGTLTVSSRSSHSQGRDMPVFKFVRSYQQSRSCHGTLN